MANTNSFFDPSNVQHEIGIAGDEGVRIHQEQSEGDVTAGKTAAAMRVAVQDKIAKL